MSDWECEVCGDEPTHACSGRDVAERFFCDVCAGEHESVCPEVSAGRASVGRFEDEPEEVTDE